MSTPPPAELKRWAFQPRHEDDNKVYAGTMPFLLAPMVVVLLLPTPYGPSWILNHGVPFAASTMGLSFCLLWRIRTVRYRRAVRANRPADPPPAGQMVCGVDPEQPTRWFGIFVWVLGMAVCVIGGGGHHLLHLLIPVGMALVVTSFWLMCRNQREMERLALKYPDVDFTRHPATSSLFKSADGEWHWLFRPLNLLGWCGLVGIFGGLAMMVWALATRTYLDFFGSLLLLLASAVVVFTGLGHRHRGRQRTDT